eukprot:6142125-Pleurochrysis_carterae.AAC.2
MLQNVRVTCGWKLDAGALLLVSCQPLRTSKRAELNRALSENRISHSGRHAPSADLLHETDGIRDVVHLRDHL